LKGVGHRSGNHLDDDSEFDGSIPNFSGAVHRVTIEDEVIWTVTRRLLFQQGSSSTSRTSGKGLPRGSSSRDESSRYRFVWSRSSGSRIVVGHPANAEASVPVDLPEFVSEMTEAGLSGESSWLSLFWDVFEILK
jgi:hypothetical protein